MPADPTATVTPATPPGRLPTNAADIGHVVPSFDSPSRFSSLVIRADLRISLRMGSIDQLCPNPPGSDLGRMERLQVLGMFYYPLGHAQASNALNGLAAQLAAAGPPALPAVPRIPGIWDAFKTRVLNGADDPAADAEIQKRLTEWVVQKVTPGSATSAYNEGGATPGGGELPVAAPDPAAPSEADGHYAKLRVPGGYTMLTSTRTPSRNMNNDPSPTYSPWTLGTSMYAVETQYRTDNPVLGKIPLIALVEKRDPDTAEWKPLKDAWVYFQLVAPYAVPAFDNGRNVHEQLNRPPIRDTSVGPPALASPNGGPGLLTTAEEALLAPPSAADPQKGNCAQNRGGEQGKGATNNGTDVAGVIFSTTSTPGFNSDPPGTRTDLMGPFLPPYPLAVNAHAGGKHLHAVKAQTNARGEAGVIFTPSRCGGDRYRFRVYVGPTTVSGAGAEGTGAQAVSVETGTLVLWRNMRISRYIQQGVGTPDGTLLADVAGAPYNLANANAYLQRAFIVDNTGANVGLPTADTSGKGNSSAVYTGLRRQWAKAFMEVDIDRAAQAEGLPVQLTQAEWLAARTRGLRDAEEFGQAAVGTSLDLRRLFCFENGAAGSASVAPTVTVTNSVVHIPMRSWQAYNALVPPANRIVGGAVGNTTVRVNRLVANYFLRGFVRHLSNNGYTPGLTIVTGGYGFTWQVIGLEGNFSGLAFDYRVAAVWAGNFAYPTAILLAPHPANTPWQSYDFSCNTAHEMGHCMYREHGPNQAGGPTVRHDTTATNQSICVMDYQDCEGEFCAKCLFAFRGWDAFQLTT